MDSTIAIDAVDVSAYRIPTDAPESDGTLAWDSTTLVLVRAHGGGQHGLGYTYADSATALLIRDRLIPLLIARDALAISARWLDMVRAIRNLGRPGITAMAIAAVDVALWDLKAKLLRVSLANLLGVTRDSIPVYGSGGFCSYATEKLCAQLAGWVDQGIRKVKMKVGREPQPEELAEKLDLFVYEADHEGGIRIADKDIHAIREAILAPKFNYGAPRVAVSAMHIDGSLELIQDYRDDGRGLDIPRAERVLDYISRIWRRPVSLQTVGSSGNPRVVSSKPAVKSI